LQRKKERDRKRAYRWNKSIIKNKSNEEADNENDDQNNVAAPDTSSKVYPTKQAAGRAVSRIKLHLPLSPRKRKAVALKIALDEGHKLLKTTANRRSCSLAISGKAREVINDFYSTDDVSWAAPGLKDGMKVIDNGKVILKQKRYMTMNIMEAYQLFKVQHPDISVGKFKFF